MKPSSSDGSLVAGEIPLKYGNYNRRRIHMKAIKAKLWEEREIVESGSDKQSLFRNAH